MRRLPLRRLPRLRSAGLPLRLRWMRRRLLGRLLLLRVLGRLPLVLEQAFRLV